MHACDVFTNLLCIVKLALWNLFSEDCVFKPSKP